MYEDIVPPQFGHAAALVAVSGFAEIAGGIGLAISPTRRAAGWGLIALLVAVWPANIFMALDAGHFAAVAPAWLLWLRVPLQIGLIWWVQRVSGSSRSAASTSPATRSPDCSAPATVPDSLDGAVASPAKNTVPSSAAARSARAPAPPTAT